MLFCAAIAALFTISFSIFIVKLLDAVMYLSLNKYFAISVKLSVLILLSKSWL